MTNADPRIEQTVAQALELEDGEQMVAAKAHEITAMIARLVELAAAHELRARRAGEHAGAGHLVADHQHPAIGPVSVVSFVSLTSTLGEPRLAILVDENLRTYEMRVGRGVPADADIETILDNVVSGTRLH